jgi:hypothetical protein
VRFEDVARVLDALDELAIDADDLLKCLHALRVLGYAAETDQLPVRIELRAPGNRWVDVHPVAFDERGHGRQAGLDGTHFDYPAGAFAHGSLRGRFLVRPGHLRRPPRAGTGDPLVVRFEANGSRD